MSSLFPSIPMIKNHLPIIRKYFLQFQIIWTILGFMALTLLYNKSTDAYSKLSLLMHIGKLSMAMKFLLFNTSIYSAISLEQPWMHGGIIEMLSFRRFPWISYTLLVVSYTISSIYSIYIIYAGVVWVIVGYKCLLLLASGVVYIIAANKFLKLIASNL